MRLDEVFKGFNLDLEQSIVIVLTEMRRQKGAVGIGSPVAAGAAQIAVAYLEEREKRRWGPELPARVRRGALQMRWMDDMWLLVKRSAGRDVRQAVSRCVQKEFYGKELILKDSTSTEVFVFQTELRGRRVATRPRWSWLHRARVRAEKQAAPGRRVPIRSGLNGGRQYRQRKVETSIAVGYLSRLLDMPNAQEEEVQFAAARITAELRRVGFEEKAQRAALDKVEQGARLKMDRARKVLSLSEEERRNFVDTYDTAEWARVLDAERRLRENRYSMEEVPRE